MSSTYTVERTRTIDVAPDRLFPLIVDFRQWTRWSPWEDLDPDLHRAYAGAESGPGATYAWSGNRKAGTGRMEILRVDEPREVEVALDFEKPFRSSSRCVFLLTPAGAGTTVTWRMVGAQPLALRLLSPVLSMDKLIGKDFERGLERMALTARDG